VLIAVLLIAPARAQQPAALRDVLDGAAGYLAKYATELAGVVLEESYVQDVRFQPVNRPGALRPPVIGPDHRALKSDLLLIRPQGADSWRQFRDVFDVDGRPVRDRNDRLAKLFLTPTGSAQDQADQIASESARYNIGDIQRNINLPLLTLLVIDRGNQPRFKFSLDRPSSDQRNLPRSAAFAPPAGAQVLRYDETQPHTMVRGAGDRDLPIHGRMWIEPGTWRVRMTELMLADRSVDARIHVSYRQDEALGLLVPAEMHEIYDRSSIGMRIEGTATYSNVRRFQVQTDEDLHPVKEH
jgi:hypothetical protein